MNKQDICLIDRARPEDVEGIAHTHNVGWEQAYRGLWPDSLLDSWPFTKRVDLWRAVIAHPSPPFHNLVALAGEMQKQPREVIGFVAGGPARCQTFPIDLEVYTLYVSPDQQRQYIGFRLFLTLIQRIQAEGQKALYLWVPVQNHRALDFFEALGGVAIGERHQAQPLEKDAESDTQSLVEVAYAWRDFDTYLQQFT